jgi:uncharacterized membrane protein
LANSNDVTHIDENVVGVLCYALGWITGLIFFLIDSRPFVRFHAMQSIVLSIATVVFYIILGVFIAIFHPFAFLYGLLGFLLFIIWIVLIVKAYRHEMWNLPVVGDLAARCSR